MAPQVAWTGLGNMGTGMVKNLVEKGNLSSPLLLHNRTTSRAHDLASTLPNGSTTVVDSLTTAVQKADIVFLCLSDDAALTSTIDSLTSDSSLNLSGKLFADASTVHPRTTAALNESLTKAGAHFVATPVFGAPAMAASGQLVPVLAGPKADVDRLKPYMTGVMARDILDFSDQPPERASLMKIIGNSMILQMVESLSEAHVVSEKSGLGSSDLHAFISKMFPGPYAAYSTRMMSGDYCKRERPLFGVDLARKDAGHVLGIAEECGVSMKGVKVTRDHLDRVKGLKGKRGDLAGVYGAVRVESGLGYEL